MQFQYCRITPEVVLVMHAVANKPATMGVDVGVPYGDYYFMLALRSSKDMKECYNN